MANDNQKKEPFEEAILEPNLLNEIAPETAMERPHIKGRLLNVVLCIFAFGMLVG